MKIIYSYGKTGYEGECWEKEIRNASDGEFTFIPFNHAVYLDPLLISDASKLDCLYRARHSALLRLYKEFESLIREQCADAVIVCNCPPYHPDFLKKISIYKVLYSADDPGSTYVINIPYLHAYNHVFFVDPAYSADMDMQEKMHYCGMLNADWLPISVFDFEFDPVREEANLITAERDIDIIYVGGWWRQKMDILCAVRRVFGRRFRMYGNFRWKHNLYVYVRGGFSNWVRPVSHQERVNLYQRAKIGINIHWNEYGLGNQRLYHLPANGVMQISDCADHHLDRVFTPGEEVLAYRNVDELVDTIRYYLDHEGKRRDIALQGYRRTMREYRFATVTRKAGRLIKEGMARLSWGA
jgi:spore maturation protein CgeB